MTAWIEIAGWTLVHFTWQGTLVGVAAAATVRLLRAASPQARYAGACAMLAILVSMPIVTAAVMWRSDRLHPLSGSIAERSLAYADGARSATPTAAVPGALTGPSRPGNGPGPVESPRQIPPSGPSASASAAADTSIIQRALPLVVLAWCVGVILLVVRTAGGWIRIRRLRNAALGAPPSPWEPSCARLASSLGISRLVRVVDSSFVDTPMVLGWLRPVILLPLAALANLSPSQVEAILAHELAHVRRHDFLVNLLQTIAETLLFYHPAVWWLSARIRLEREHCCDAVAVALCGDALSYAEALAELETSRHSGGVLAMAATGGPLLDRVRRLLAPPVRESRRLMDGMTLAAAAAMVTLGWGATYLVVASPREPGQESAAAPASTSSRGEAAAWRMVFHHESGELAMMGFTARDLIRFAYQIPRARVIGGPAWLDQEIDPIRVGVGDVLAQSAGSSAAIASLLDPPAADQMPSIVRRALEDRLRLQVHVETRDLPAYALVMARPDGTPGPGLRASPIDCFDLEEWIAAGQPPREPRPNAQRQPVCGEEAWDSTMARTSWVAITMQQLAAEMRGFSRRAARARGAETLDVIDRTGLTGKYDVDLHVFLPATALMARYPALKMLLEPLGLSSRERALEQQLGLRLVETTAPYDVIVVDHAERPAG